MNSRIWLRAAAILTLIHAILHTIGGVYGSVPSGSPTVAVTAMKANTFIAFGSLRSFWIFYHGMGLIVAVFLVLGAVIFWLLGDLTDIVAARLRPILITFAIGYVALATVSLRFFFFGPVITELLIAACLLMASAGLRYRIASV